MNEALDSLQLKLRYNILTLFLWVLQKDDLKAVVDYLRSDGNTSMIGLWGRSMGAVTRFRYASYLFWQLNFY